MFGIIATWLVNLTRALRNGWRRLLRRRVDYVRLEIGGALPEFAPGPRWWQRRFLGAREPASLHGLRRQLQRIAADREAAGVLLKIDALTAGWATLQSLRDELEHFRRGGKRVVAYLLAPDMRGYAAACAADEIIVPPLALLTIVGLRVEAQFIKDALAKVGIIAEYEAVSPYKSGGDMFVRSDISPESREQYERLLDDGFGQLVRAIASARGKTEAQVRDLIDAAPLSALDALERGLVDALCYEDELETYLKRDQRAAKILDWDQARRALRLPYARRHRRLVAVVPVEGAIATGRSRNLPLPIPLLGGPHAGSDSVAQALREVERNRRVGAVVLYVNSPGGDVLASDLIWREVLRVGRRKPVVVAMGDVAASGGYYIAAPAASIVAQPGTITGSIGVFLLRPIVSGALDRAGVNTVVISRGANSGFLNVTESPTESERQATRALVARAYAEFKTRVRESRRMDDEQLEPIAGGRVWTGARARELGLVDQLGGLPEALLRAQTLAAIPEDRSAPILLARPGRSRLPPEPFPLDKPADAQQLLKDALRPRILAILPFDWV